MEHTPIPWMEERADFVPGVFDTGRKVHRPNAQVVGIAIFRGLTYREQYTQLTDDFWEWLSKPGRRSRVRRQYQSGFNSFHTYRIPGEFYKQWLGQRYLWVPLMRPGQGTVIRLDEGVFGTERVLVRCSSDELIPVIDGVARYPYNPNRKWQKMVDDQDAPPDQNTRAVYGYWTKED